MADHAPDLSVVVPAYNGAEVLRRSLAALRESKLTRSRWELIVVDDGSTDDTACVAAEHGAMVVRLPDKPRGPAYARNRGVEASRGEVVVFVDADVCVHNDTLSKITEAFAVDGEMAALFGSYDAEPLAPGMISQFRNLLHHSVHHASPGDAETFWAGCGAVRRQIFIDVGLMDAWHFRRPQIEDIEFGRRLRMHGHRIVLRPDIQCTHLKRWTFRNMITTDFRDRGVPWMRLLLSEGAGGAPATLNLRMKEKVCTALAGLTAGALVMGVVLTSTVLLTVAAMAVCMMIALNSGFYRFLARRRGPLFAVGSIPLHYIFYFTGGCAAVAGILCHFAGRIPAPPADVLAGAAAARGDWPPPADRPPTGVWTLAAARRA
jgi:GT2 family glycosyltransferase